jgi:hypothetical protein
MLGAWPSTSQRVDALPRLPNSDTMVANLGTDRGLHADFGSSTWEGVPDRAADSRGRRRLAPARGPATAVERVLLVDLHAAAVDAEAQAARQQVQQLHPDHLATPALQRAHVRLRVAAAR